MNKETAAAVPVVTALLAQGVPYAVFLLRWLLAIRAIAQQTSEWSPKMEEDFIHSLIATALNPVYLPDGALTARI